MAKNVDHIKLLISGTMYYKRPTYDILVGQLQLVKVMLVFHSPLVIMISETVPLTYDFFFLHLQFRHR